MGALLTAVLLFATCGGGGGGGGGGPALLADFAADRGLGRAPLLVQFEDLSKGAVTSWSWDFGDGGSSQERNPAHEYAGVGSFDVTLTVMAGAVQDTKTLPGLIEALGPPEPQIEYGMNPSFARWSSRAILFCDAMMRASEFVLVRDGELTLEAAPLLPFGRSRPRLGEGWPDPSGLVAGDSAGAWLFGAMEGSMPSGLQEPWILTWEGTGSCHLIGNAVVSSTRKGARRVEVRVAPDAGNGNGTVALWIEFSSTVDPVRDVHVWLPGTSEERPLFWPPYIEKVQAMNWGTGPRVWRTLDWTRVNDYGALDPPFPFTFDLPGMIRPGSPSQGTRRGLCPEFQVAFCNAVGADLHFLVPHRTEQMGQADYEWFLRDTFTRIRDGSPGVPGINGEQPFAGLDDGLELILEYSNELWNALFPSSRWLHLQAALRGETLQEVIAAELLGIWRIADEVFAGRRTVRRFLGSFIAEADFVGRILDALPAGTRVDSLGPSCYFRPRQEAIAGWMRGATESECPNCPSPEAVIAASWTAFDELRPHLRAHRRLVESRTNPDGSHPTLVVYEGGQSFDAQGAPWADAARSAQKLPAMYDAYVDGLIPLLVGEGVALVNWYSFMTDQDPSHGIDIGFGIWNDMNQAIHLPVGAPYRDEGAPKAAAVYLGPPLQ